MQLHSCSTPSPLASSLSGCRKQGPQRTFHSQSALSPVECRALDIAPPHLSSHYPCKEIHYQASWHMREGMLWETVLLQGPCCTLVIELDIQRADQLPWVSLWVISDYYFKFVSIIQVLLSKQTLSTILLDSGYYQCFFTSQDYLL